MRVAISGTHRVGKSTLVEELGAVLPKYATVAEPYELLEEDGYESATPPTAEDFEAQLECSLGALADDQDNVIFDRCPADVVAYLQALGESIDDEVIERVREAMNTLDLVVFVPIEARVKVRSDDLREDVDEKLRSLLPGFDVEVLEVHGDVDSRVRMISSRM
ncbi:MAG: ATP-binding protein [Archangium sp.]